LPVQVHAAGPLAGRFTSEIESDIVKCNTLDAVKTIVKECLVFELIRSKMDPRRTRFAGVMTYYGPTAEFAKDTIGSHTRGLFLDPDSFKKWWLAVATSKRVEGEKVKMAVVLWNAEEAAAKRVELPDFWPNLNARLLSDLLGGKEYPIWDLEVEKSCNNLIKTHQQLQEARNDAALATNDVWKAERKELQNRVKALEFCEAKLNKIIDAFEGGDLPEVARLIAEEKKSKGKPREEEADNVPKDEVYEDEEEDEDTCMALAMTPPTPTTSTTFSEAALPQHVPDVATRSSAMLVWPPP